MQILVNCEPLAIHFAECKEPALRLDESTEKQLETGSFAGRGREKALTQYKAAVGKGASSHLSGAVGSLIAKMRAAEKPKGLSALKVAFAAASTSPDGSRFDGGSQQDAGEFLEEVLAQAAEDEKVQRAIDRSMNRSSVPPEAPTVVEEVFGWKRKTIVTCRKCKLSFEKPAPKEREGAPFQMLRTAPEDVDASTKVTIKGLKNQRKGPRQDLVQLIAGPRRARRTCGAAKHHGWKSAKSSPASREASDRRLPYLVGGRRSVQEGDRAGGP